MEYPITEKDLIEFKDVYSLTALLRAFANDMKTIAYYRWDLYGVMKKKLIGI